MTENNIDKTTNTIVAIIFITLLLATMLLAVFITINALSQASTDTNGITIGTESKANETIAFANTSGYTLLGTSYTGFTSPTITALYNRTNGNLINVSGNVTLSDAGVLRNSTIVVWNNLTISYTFNYDSTNNTITSTTYEGIKTNIFSMVTNFFALMPTVGTILAVVILIAGIVVLVLYIKKMKDKSTSEGYYTG